MKKRMYLQIRVVTNMDPEQFQNEFNAAQVELASKRPQSTFSIDGETFKAVIQYEEVKYIPETAKDHAQLDEISITCAECPYFERDKNKDGSPRMISKHGSCHLMECTRLDSDACEWFYKRVLAGKDNPIEWKE